MAKHTPATLMEKLTKVIDKADDHFRNNKAVILEYFKLEEEKRQTAFFVQERLEMLVEEGAITEPVEILNPTVELRVRLNPTRVNLFETKLYKVKPKQN